MTTATPTRRTRASAKTGDPQADKAARAVRYAKAAADRAAAETAEDAPKAEPKTTAKAATKPARQPRAKKPAESIAVNLDGEPDGASKADKRTAKQALARKVLDAVSGIDGLTAEDKRTVAQWLHHIHGGTTPDGKRYWPASLPTPNRSDWKA
jgi:hypothetical protein